MTRILFGIFIVIDKGILGIGGGRQDFFLACCDNLGVFRFARLRFLRNTEIQLLLTVFSFLVSFGVVGDGGASLASF